ncbi:MAG TPA: hypothetical protein VFV13_05930 [Acidimicrobiia bacterium]|nr:hypothetical protein [Acidimicrobiia bacterium]
MRRLQRTVLTALLTVGLVAGSSVAWAQTDEDGETEAGQNLIDTLFNFGYDVVNRVFLWNTSQLDGPYDCTLENGPITATYGETSDEGVILVDMLDGGSGALMFPNRPAEEVGEDQEPATSPVPYTGADGECGVSGGDPTGPAGQINHGMFMRLFNSMYQGEGGRGCLIRHIAQSDLGKGDQQVQAGEAVTTDPVAAGDTGSVEFTTEETDCEHGRVAGTDSTDQSGRPEGAGPPDHAGRPDHAGPPDHAGGAGGAGNGNGGGNGGGNGNGNGGPGN